MQDHRMRGMSRPVNERENRQLQRAVMAKLLSEFPTQVTRHRLRNEGFGFETLDRVIFILDCVGLVFCEGNVILPTLPARHLDWLEAP